MKTWEKGTLWSTLLVFTWDDGKWFMRNIIVNQAKENSQYLHFNIPLNWIVHHTLYGCMDRYGLLKATNQLSTICGTYTIKNQPIFFNENDTHFNDRTLCYTDDQNIQFLPLKPVDFGNYQPNDNGKNEYTNSS